jgi:hypothetical protein
MFQNTILNNIFTKGRGNKRGMKLKKLMTRMGRIKIHIFVFGKPKGYIGEVRVNGPHYNISKKYS